MSDAEFAPLAIRSNMTDRLAEKFLEVALDAHSITSEIALPGALKFALDMKELFGAGQLPPLAMRLIDVANLMSMDPKSYHDLRDAFHGLVNAPDSDICSTPFDVEDFARDGTLSEQAGSMIAAKGFNWLSLEDVLIVLNSRHV